ncbi:MAG: hypothetical protein KDJ36_12295, partial [Hyphomicrobiaceae bacterium]|nr:hypothetical protein [Hyphomicrobiaceae bacterium]
IANFEWLAIAAYRMRGTWPRAETALEALEAWRQDWNIVASAALVHAREDLLAMDTASPDYERAQKTLLDLVDIIAVTFRPLNGPKAGWVGVQAHAVEKAPH